MIRAKEHGSFTFSWNVENIGTRCSDPITYNLISAQFEFDLCTNIHFIGNFSIQPLPNHQYKLVVELKSTTHSEWHVKCTILNPRHLETDFDQSIFRRELKFIYGSEFNNVQCRILYIANTSTVKPISSCEKSKFKNEFSQFFEKKQFADVLLKVAGKEIYSHRVILAQISPVFKTMFENQMKDGLLTNVLIIDNMEPTVFEEMLRFMYLGEVSNLKTFADKLLPVSIEYDLPTLKSMCEKELAANITIENVIEILSLASLHKAEELKQQAINFIKDNIETLPQILDNLKTERQ